MTRILSKGSKEEQLFLKSANCRYFKNVLVFAPGLTRWDLGNTSQIDARAQRFEPKVFVDLLWLVIKNNLL